MVFTINTKQVSSLDFRSQEEPNRAYTRGVEWPRYGGCVVARARTHVRSSREKTGQPEWDLGPHSWTIMGPHEYYCALLYESPQLFTKGLANAQKNIAAKWWRRLQQLPPCSAQSSTIIAQHRTSPVSYKLRDSLKRLVFILFRRFSSGEAANQSAKQSPF